MKIAIIVRTYSKRGGISGYAAQLAERFAENNEVHIFAAHWQDVGNRKIIFHKIPMISFNFLKKMKKFAWNNVFEIWSFMLFSFFMVHQNRFDLVHSQGDYIGKFDVFTVHSCHKAWLSLANQGKLSFLEKLKKSSFNPLHLNVLLVERYSLKTAKKIIAISQSAKNEIMQFYKVPEEKIAVIPNGVDINKFNIGNKDKYRKEVRNSFGLKENNVVIVFSAHEFKRKGLFQIIEALNLLKDKEIYVLVIGRDSNLPFVNLLEQYNLAKNFIFTGETAEIEKYYASADLFVFPTAYEPFGLVITEAMASGLPVLVTKDAGASELIEGKGREYLLSDFRDAKEIARKIELLAKNPALCAEIGSEERKTAESYSWDIITERTKTVYDEAIA